MYSRKRTLSRYGTQLSQPTVKPYTFPASVGGVNAVDSLMMMPPQDCIYTYNLMPSEYGMRLRKGYRQWTTGCFEDPQRAPNVDVRSIIPFESNIQDAANDRLFAVTAEGIWDVTLFNTILPNQEAVFTQTADPAGYGVWTEFTGDAAGSGLRGHYLFYADGLNGIWQYGEDTDAWTQPISGTGAGEWSYNPDGGGAVGFPVDNVAFVMVFKQRIWVILEDEDDAWYLPVASVTGELKKFNFGSKMPHGGNLVGLWNWTVDGGNGVDDMLVAISRGGDVIIYQGEDPEITPTEGVPWQTRGAWFIGAVPNSRRIVADYGPDLYVLSTYGLTSLNDLLRGNPITGQTPSRKINRFLRADVENGKDSSAWQLVVHPADGFLQIVTPKPAQTPYIQYTQNLQTAAWGFWEGVPILGADSWSGDYYMGGEDGVVYINDGPLDNTELLNEDYFQDVNPVVGTGWTVPIALEFACDGTQVAETKYTTDLLVAQVIGQEYRISYRVKNSTLGYHKIQVGTTDITTNTSGSSIYTEIYVATTADTTISLVGDADFVGTIYDVNISIAAGAGAAIGFRTLTSFQAPAGHSNFNRVGFIRTIGILAGSAAINVSAVYDYKIEQRVTNPVQVPIAGTDLWDSSVWDSATWDSTIEGQSFTAGSLGMGRVFAVGVNGSANSRINIVGFDCLFTTGGYL